MIGVLSAFSRTMVSVEPTAQVNVAGLGQKLTTSPATLLMLPAGVTITTLSTIFSSETAKVSVDRTVTVAVGVGQRLTHRSARHRTVVAGVQIMTQISSPERSATKEKFIDISQH